MRSQRAAQVFAHRGGGLGGIVAQDRAADRCVFLDGVVTIG
jgi:hypothetical protein